MIRHPQKGTAQRSRPDQTGVRPVRLDRRRRRATSTSRRHPIGRRAERVRVGRRRSLGGDAGDRVATPRQFAVERTGELSDQSTDSGSHVRLSRRSTRLSPEFLHLIPNGFRHRRPRRWRSSRQVIACSCSGRGSHASGPLKIRVGIGWRTVLIAETDYDLQPLRIFAPVSLATVRVGAAYAVWTIATQSHVTNSSVLLILLSVIMFLIGLVSEQIVSLRFERPRE